MSFPTEAELRAMTVKQLRQHIKEMNEHYAIRGYYKMNKDQLINSIGTAHLRIGKGEAGHPSAQSKKSMPKETFKKSLNKRGVSGDTPRKSILEKKIKQKPGRPAKTSTAVAQRIKKSY